MATMATDFSLKSPTAIDWTAWRAQLEAACAVPGLHADKLSVELDDGYVRVEAWFADPRLGRCLGAGHTLDAAIADLQRGLRRRFS